MQRMTSLAWLPACLRHCEQVRFPFFPPQPVPATALRVDPNRLFVAAAAALPARRAPPARDALLVVLHSKVRRLRAAKPTAGPALNMTMSKCREQQAG